MSDALEQNKVILEHVETTRQAANIFTKNLEPCKWPHALELIGMQVAADGKCTTAVSACAPPDFDKRVTFHPLVNVINGPPWREPLNEPVLGVVACDP